MRTCPLEYLRSLLKMLYNDNILFFFIFYFLINSIFVFFFWFLLFFIVSDLTSQNLTLFFFP